MLERCITLASMRMPSSNVPARRMKRPRSLIDVVEPYRRSSASAQSAPKQYVPVTIVGAGPAGLTMSCLLSQFGVPSILLEKALALPTHPQAHFINLRSMEIMRHAFRGLDRAVLERCPPREEWRSVQSPVAAGQGRHGCCDSRLRRPYL